VSGVAVNRGTRVRASCHGTDRAVIKLNAVNIDCPNTSKQRKRVGAHDSYNRLWNVNTPKLLSCDIASTGVDFLRQGIFRVQIFCSVRAWLWFAMRVPPFPAVRPPWDRGPWRHGGTIRPGSQNHLSGVTQRGLLNSGIHGLTI